ncbi:MAG: hypothetical protein Roseis2KO_49890 [Roseivirga sp.]
MKTQPCIILILAINAFFIAHASYAQKENEHKRLTRVKNEVSEVIEYQHNLETGDSLLYRRDFYNKEGRRTKGLSYSKTGKLKTTFVSYFNRQGFMTKQSSLDSLNNETGSITYKFDKKGNRVDYKQWRDGKVLIHQKRKYKKGLNTQLINRVYGGSTYYLASEYSYNKEGLYTLIKSYDPSGRLTSTSDYQYDQTESTVKVFRTEGTDTRLTSITYYNSNGLIEKRHYPRKSDKIVAGSLKTLNIVKEILFEYDQLGNLTTELTYENEKLVKKRTWMYLLSDN